MTEGDATGLVELVSDLVAIETENPPGNERACAEYVVDWFEGRGIDAELVREPIADRPQAAARVGEGTPTVVLNGHLDVVPAGPRDEWTTDPYEPHVADGRLYGRGTADMKTGIAIAMLTAARLDRFPEAGDLDGSIVVHGAMGEETADPGTKALLEAGYDGDYGVVLEPTSFRTATGEKGLAWYTITVGGESSHASRPDQGSNAVVNARPVLDALEAYDRRVRERADDLVGQAYATVTEFAAGIGGNEGVLPSSARIVLDRRILPGETIPEVDEEVDAVLADVERDHGIDVSVERTTSYESAEIPADSDLAAVFRDLSADLAGASTGSWGIEASTDVRNFVNDAGIEAVTWGPGDIERAHTVDEYVEVPDAETGLEILERATRRLLAGGD